jgi:hypothetical protein
MITKKLKKAVVKEALLLRKYATQEEKYRLNADIIDPIHTNHCLYGQMTYNCESPRALELLKLCAKPYSYGCSYYGKPSQQYFYIRTYGYDVSAIEFYICQEGAKIKELIKS